MKKSFTLDLRGKSIVDTIMQGKMGHMKHKGGDVR